MYSTLQHAISNSGQALFSAKLTLLLLLQNWASALGRPTSLTQADGYIAIGGESGGIVCVPKAAFGSGNPAGSFELLDSKGLLSSFFTRSAKTYHLDWSHAIRVLGLGFCHSDGPFKSGILLYLH